MFVHEQQADSLEHARELSRTRYFWWVNYLTDYTGHDFLWEPMPWENSHVHVWPSQHQKDGGTYLSPKYGHNAVNYNHPVLPRKHTVPVIGIDHGDGIDFACDYQTRFISDYLGTLRRAVTKVDAEYVWVASSVCDYTDFDWTWHPSEWQQTMLHVFPSNDQKFGDTFYIHIPTFLEQTENLALLEWFNTIAFQSDISVPRKPIPRIQHNYDTHVQAVWEHEFKTPVVEFAVDDSIGPGATLNLWRTLVRAVTPLSPGASRVIVPREAKTALKTQLYDYHNIDKSHTTGPDQLLDIVFIDNGEPNAELNYNHLKWAAERAHQPNIHRSSGVNGRVAAYQAAARLSTTPWFFAVFAKLEVSSSFDWAWQPDRLQEPKHYIFHAKNPVNNLKYGHMAMIAYNKQLVLGNTGKGLDFTLDSPHEVIPILSGVAHYADTPWMAWRTAFREALKLKASLPNVENEYRLFQWTHVHNGGNGIWSVNGANDAIEYYEAVGGDFDELKKSYDWAWLASYAFMKHSLSPDQ